MAEVKPSERGATCQQLIAAWRIRSSEGLAQLSDGDILVPQKVGSKLAHRHVGRQAAHS
jgi:hypothetical protein